jgi:hypothetical protein
MKKVRKIISPKEIINEKWEKTFSMASASAFNAESCLLAALEEMKIFDLRSAKKDIQTAILFIHSLRESLPPIQERGKPEIVKGR